MSKILFSIILTFVLISSVISVSAQSIATDQDVKQAGILPSSPVYALKAILFRFEDTISEKARINHAQQRLSEILVMLNQSNFQGANRSIKEFNFTINQEPNKTRLKEHINLVNNLGQQIKLIASQHGALNETDREIIKGLIEAHKDRVFNETLEINEDLGQDDKEIVVGNVTVRVKDFLNKNYTYWDNPYFNVSRNITVYLNGTLENVTIDPKNHTILGIN